MTRNINFLVIGLTWSAPTLELWYSKLLPLITTKYIDRLPVRWRIWVRLLIDGSVYGPTAYMGFYLYKIILE